jgi:hypothetical protein
MINSQTTLGHQLFQIAICEAISQVPPDAQDDDLIFEMASSEQSRSRLWHQAHGIRDRPAAFATDPVDLLYEFDPNEHPAGIVELLEAEHRLHPSLDAPVVLLHDVVQELTGADLDCIRPPKVEFIPHAHPPQCGMGRLKAVERDGSGLAVPL